MLGLHTADVPQQYQSLLPHLLTPPVWQQTGSIPGLVKLLKAYLKRNSAQMLAAGQVASVLAVVQQRLIPSKMNDSWGFELLQAVVSTVKPDQLKQYFKAIVMTLLIRMHTNKSDKYVYLFTHFFLFMMAIDRDGLTPDYVISTVEEIQSQLWSQILDNFIVPQVPKMPNKDKKLAFVGVTRLLTQSSYMLQQPSVNTWPSTFAGLAKLFTEPQHLSSKEDDSGDVALTEIDFEEQTAGYQAAYSRISASATSETDPVEYVRDPQTFLGQGLVKLSKQGVDIKRMLGASPMPNVAMLLQALASTGYVI